jgi:unsaturated rhamnogalacturonyl hydrolase
MNLNQNTKCLLILMAVLSTACSSHKKMQRSIGSSKEQVLVIIEKVNESWQDSNPPEASAFWDVAAYHTGNMEAYFLTKKETYRKYSEAWAEYNQWKGAKSDNRNEWKYTYGEKDDHVLFGDWQICFQTYADLYNLEKSVKKIARAREVMEYEMSTEKNDYWWWADGLYMVMPVMTKLYRITGNQLYLNKLHEYFSLPIALCTITGKNYTIVTRNMFSRNTQLQMAKKIFGQEEMDGCLQD